MKKFIELLDEKRGKIPLNMHVGTSFIGDDGYEIEIINIELVEMHKPSPKVIVSYKYKSSDGKNKGREDKYLEAFAKDIIGNRLK